MKDQGWLVRELSEPEYRLARARVQRGCSGHWMIFHLAPALDFGLLYLREAESAAP